MTEQSHITSSRLVAIIANSDDAIIGKDLHGTVTSWNHGAEQVFGFSAEEMVGNSIMKVIPADRQEEERGVLEKISRGESVKHFETRRVCNDGHEIDMSITASPIRDAAGTVVGISNVARDITERKQAEGAQRATDAYRALFDYAPDGIIIADRESYYLDANASMCRMLGYTHDELVGLHASDIVAPAETSHIATALRTITRESGYHREWRFRRKDGSIFSADVIASVMPDGNLVGMVRDVTERNDAVAALRTAEERMRFALESGKVGIWDMDYTTGVLRWSEILEAQHGLPPGTFGGTFDDFVACVHPDDRADLLKGITEAMAKGADFAVQYRSVGPDGTVRWLSGSGRIYVGEHGEPVRGLGTLQDVTERQHAEIERRRLNDEIQRQRMRIFKATMRTVQDIVNNLLSSFALVRLEAGDHLPPETQKLVDRTIHDAAVKLRTLGDLEIVNEKEMIIGLGIDYPGSSS